jgi:transposase-like protein
MIWLELLKEDVNESEFSYNDAKNYGHSDSEKEGVISLHHSGKSIREREDLTNIPKSTIQRWIKKLNETA